MEINVLYTVEVITVVTIFNFITRVFPFALFAKRKVPETIQYLGKVLPPAVMVILVVYCLRNIQFVSGNHGLPELISALLVVVLHLWKKNTLISIGVSTACYMFLIQVVFK